MKIETIIKNFRFIALFPVALLSACAGLQDSQFEDRSALQTDQARINPLNPEANLPADGAYHLVVAELAIRNGQTDLAIEHYLELARSQSDPNIAERAARIAVYGENLEAAIEAAQRWVELDPDNMEARQIIAAIYLRNGQTDEAFRYLDELITTNEISDQALFTALLAMLAREKNTTEVLMVTRRIAEKHADRAFALYMHGMLTAQNGDPEEALTYLDRTLEKQELQGIHNARAKILLKLGRPEEAVVSLRMAVLAHPEDQPLRLNYARLLVDLKEYETARIQFERLHQAAPDDIDLLYTLGLLSLESQRLDDAQIYMLKLVELNAREGEAQYYLGRINENLKRYAEAIDWYEKVHVGDYQFDARLRIASLMGESGRLDQAREYLASMLKGSQSPHALGRIYLADAELLRSAKRFDAAMEVYNTALGIIPGDKDLLYARALTAEKVGRIDILEADIKTILATDPDNANALNALGFTLADQTNRYDEALSLLRRANELLPENAAILDSLGWVNFRLGHYEEAIRLLRAALSKLKDSEIAAHLGEVLWVSGNQDEARSIWQQALEDSPDDELIKAVLRRFLP